MIDAFTNKIALLLSSKSVDKYDDTDIYLISLAATIYCAIVHIYLLAGYLSFNAKFYVVLNICSLNAYMVAFLLLSKHKYKAVILLISVEVTAYASLSILMNGALTYIAGYYLLVIILQIILPYASTQLRAGVIAGILVACVTCLFLTRRGAQQVYEDSLHNFLMYSNIVILFAGIIIQLCIRNIIKSIVGNLQRIQISDLTQQANTDPLTKLFNRRYADEYFAAISRNRRASSHCVAMLDIDDFKVINDSYGHDCGDVVLVFLASFIKENLRQSDMVFRWGGEEFLMTLENLDLETAHIVLEKLRAKLAETLIHTPQGNIRITVTIGVTALDPHDTAASIAKCDYNMYRGKQSIKNMVVAI